MATDVESQRVEVLVKQTLKKCIESLHDERLLGFRSDAEAAPSFLASLSSLRKIVQQAWTLKSNDVSHLLSILTVASRDPTLRPLLGGCLDGNQFTQESILGFVFDHILPERTLLDDPNLLMNALKLISNCVADTNCNRKLALEKDVVQNLLRLAKENRSIDFVIPALYNLCVEYEDPREEIETGASTKCRANLVQVELAHSDCDGGVIQALFAMSKGISSEADQREPLLASLIEMVSLTAPEDLLCVGISPDMNPEARNRVGTRAILTFLGPSAAPLISHDGDTAISICNALLNVLAASELKQNLVSERQLQALASLSYSIGCHRQELLTEGHEEDTITSLAECEKALLKEIYTLTGLPEFTAAYTLDNNAPGAEFIRACIEVPRDPRSQSNESSITHPSIAIAYTVLANLTVSEDSAVQLVQTHQVHEPLRRILQGLNDVDTLFPALGLLSRLSLPSANKEEIFNCGMLGAVRRFLSRPGIENSTDWKPALRIEALTTLRRLISSQIEALHSLQQQDDHSKSYIQDILDLFNTSKDSATKVEIGRLCVECFRTMSLTQDPLDPSSKQLAQMVTQVNLAEPIGFLACEGPSPGAKAEGWFGLGLMTFWTQARAQVLEAIMTPRMMDEVSKIADESATSDKASVDNLKLVLSKLDLEESATEVNRDMREAFASAKRKLGLQDQRSDA